MTDYPEGRQPAHMADRSNAGLLTGLVVAMIVAVVLGALVAGMAREHGQLTDAREEIDYLTVGQDAAQSELAGVEATLERERTEFAASEIRVAACEDVVKVSTLQRKVIQGTAEVSQVNRLLRRLDHPTYAHLWAACHGHDHEEH